ncbi:hypothetical protein N7519_011485 [Penicillium mononematosum]|uniref:uncharacterized protein n=1 Tax=Penicillium mononematosum TaxID=268346 RepID=UPI002549BA8A|nr:uncharacterized protein N7519_011485 [Penicillium mononematosum]KAJ6181024.1 hypothetical protein N7519_011485 [Penicillium mononematosum]
MRREYIPIESLPAWQRLNGVVVQGIAVHKLGSDQHGGDKGSALIATEAQMSSENDAKPKVLLQVPSELVLSLETVQNHAKTDRYLRDVLENIGDFGRTARGAILIFLLIQLSHSSPDLRSANETIGISNPWTEYVKFLPPSFPLPTFYTAEEQELLRGTSLTEALDAKFASLEREFEHLRQATEGIAWCQRSWWDEKTGALTIDDWKYVDAAYRSRMLDLPGSGLSMVPCIDMANHGSGDGVKALYDADPERNAVLQLRWGKALQPGEEVTISYGDEKPASEMIFSYGFLESGTTDAREIFLNLDIPEDDPLGLAKRMFCQNNSGIRISSVEGSEEVTWESGLVWIACVNEEDGLHFGIAQTTDGGRELETTWKGEKIQSASHLRELLAVDPLWDIFQLRAAVLLLERLETQLALLQETGEIISSMQEDKAALDSMFRPGIFTSIAQYRALEGELLEKAVEELIKQRTELLASKTVAEYFSAQTAELDEAEDFS